MGDSGEKRTSRRVGLKSVTIHGKLYNVVQFKVKDLSWGGINILSNFQAAVGHTYTICLFQNGHHLDFEIEVLRAEVESIVNQPTDFIGGGLLLSIAARFINLNEERKSFLRHFLAHGDDGNDIGYFPEAEISESGDRSKAKP